MFRTAWQRTRKRSQGASHEQGSPHPTRQNANGTSQGITVPQPFDLGDQFTAGIAGEQRGRPIELRDLPAGTPRGKLSGAWIATGDTDVIFLDPERSAGSTAT